MPHHLPPQIIAQGKHVDLVKRGHWEYATRRGSSGVVAIAAVTDQGELLLVEQERPPVRATVVEIPAGLAGDVAGQEDEALEAAARRELLEETGYEAAEMVHLAQGASSAGITDEMIAFYRAKGLRKMHDGGGDHYEAITVHAIPLDQVHGWLMRRIERGEIVDSKVFAALYFVRREGGAA